MQFLKRTVAVTLALCLLIFSVVMISATESMEAISEVGNTMELPCRSAVLMDAKTGQVLFEQNADEALPPASVTKIMTLLLVMEAIDEGRYEEFYRHYREILAQRI